MELSHMHEFKLGFGIGKNARIAENITELVGNTPMAALKRYGESKGLKGNVIAKLEYFNPLGSVKDRVAVHLLECAEKAGLIGKDTVIIEPTSGNTGIGLAFAAAVKGYRLILVMPENMSEERVKLMKALSAEVILSPAEKGMTGAVEQAKRLNKSYPDSYMPDQFGNPENPNIHRTTTAAEILKDTYGNIDCFVAGVGTGGTITGVGEVLKAYNKKIKIVAVQPAESPVLTGGVASSHALQGMGANFVPPLLNMPIIDEIIDITGEQAFAEARLAAKSEGLLVGISSGAALCAASIIALRDKMKGKNIVVLLPDGGERYLSSELFKK
ncbi:MAG: cysteine synthase A [Oscillospiraceae bacterium]|nr:cysteine synthase A [Oscillospiraceae bacterium]